jgi:gliding motility-associated-like protein
VTCTNPTAKLTAADGASYLWSTGENTAIINVTPTTPTTYTVTVTGSNGCTAAQSISIDVDKTPPSPSIIISENSGISSNDGKICSGASVLLTATGGNLYNWNTGETLATITVTPLSTTTYTVTVTGSNGCTNNSNITINVNSNPTPAISGPSPICLGTDGNIYTTDAGMNNYTWNIPAGGVITSGGGTTDNTVTIRWNAAGLQTISVNYSNSNNCSALLPTTFDVTVEKTPIANAGADDTICYDASYKIPSASVQNEISYQWKTLGDGKFENNSGTIADELSPTYTPGDNDKTNGSVKLVLNVTGAASCSNATDTLVLYIPMKLQAAIGAPKPFDIDANTEIKVAIKTSGHRNIQDLSYYLVAPDGITKVLLKGAANPLVNCNRGYDADITFNSQHLPITDTLKICGMATPLTGTFAAKGDWSVLYNKFNPAEGGWAVMVTDNQTLTPVTTWTQGAITLASISFKKNDTTILFNSGTVNIPIGNGTSLAPKPTSFIVPLGLRTTCFNSCDAKAIVNSIGGIAPYTYVWNDASSSTTKNVDLCKGTYSVTVTDAIGCSAIASVDVTSPDPIVINSVAFSNNDTLKCVGETTDITINATGGTGAIKYTYAGAPAANDTLPSSTAFTDITAGSYNFHIFDENGCFKDTTINIFAPDTIKAKIDSITNVVCYGSATGSVVVKGMGGTKKYVFTLKNAGGPLDTIYTMQDSAYFSGLVAGNYTIALRDTNNCSLLAELPFTITQPAMPLSVDKVTFGKITPCALDKNGWAKFVVSNGTTPYTYILRNTTDTVKSATDSLSGLKPGDYTALVTDSNKCEAIYPTPISIISNPAIVVTKFDINAVSKCSYNANGSINVALNRTNGDPTNIVVAIDTITGTYHSLSADPANDYLFTGLKRGWHKFYAKDSSDPGSCVFTDSAYITSPAPIVITTQIDFISKNQRKITVNATGGTGTLLYAFIDSKRDTVKTYGFSTNNVFDMDTLGIYSVLVQDAENCTIEKQVNLADFKITVTNVTCKGSSTGAIEIVPGTSGTYFYDLNSGLQNNSTGKFTDLAAGKYKIEVLNPINEVLYSDSAVITQPDSMLWIQTLTFDTINKCAYSRDVTAAMMIIPYGGTKLYTYSSDSITFISDPSMVFFGQGIHKVYVQDSIGCIVASVPIKVNAPAPVVISVVSVTPVKGATTGSISLKASGPNKPIMFSIDGTNWYGNDSTYTFTGLKDSTYTFYARNTVPCYDTLQYTIPLAGSFPVKISIDTSNMVCYGDENAILSFDIIDPITNIGPYRYYVSTLGSDTLTFSDVSYSVKLKAGACSIYIEDKDGNVFTKDTVIPGPPKVTLSAIPTKDNCRNLSTIDHIGAIRLFITPADLNYTYKWTNDSTSSQITNVKAGTYGVTVTYGKNDICKVSDSYIVETDDKVSLSVSPKDTTVCPQSPFAIEAKGAQIYSWYPKPGLSDTTIWNPTVNVSSTSTYHVIGYDNNKICYDTASVKINVYSVNEVYPNPDTVDVPFGQGAQLQANDGFAWYAWTPADYLDNPAISNPYVLPNVSTVYIVTGLTANSCIAADTVYVIVASQIKVPSGFTPNGDGINDIWEIAHAEKYNDIVVEVFTRAGQKVFSSKGYKNNPSDERTFTGKVNGKDLPVGAYYYIIIPTKGAEGITGTVTIVR